MGFVPTHAWLEELAERRREAADKDTYTPWKNPEPDEIVDIVTERPVMGPTPGGTGLGLIDRSNAIYDQATDRLSRLLRNRAPKRPTGYAKGGRVEEAIRALAEALKRGDNSTVARATEEIEKIDPTMAKRIRKQLAENTASYKIGRFDQPDVYAKGGKIRGKVENVKPLLDEIKLAIFETSDEPDWNRADALLRRVPGGTPVRQQLADYRNFLEQDLANPHPDFERENRRRVIELGNMVEGLSPSKGPSTRRRVKGMAPRHLTPDLDLDEGSILPSEE